MAIVSSCLGGSAWAGTWYLLGYADPVILATLRWDIGFLCVLAAVLALRVRWPSRHDLPSVIAPGLCFFGLFYVLYYTALGYTTAARASLALSTLPLLTMIAGILLGIETLTARKVTGVCIAMLGVFAALASGVATTPIGAWRAELIMTAAVLCMALYNVWSRPFIQRSSPLGFRATGMGAGATALIVFGVVSGRVSVLTEFGPAQWIAGIYLGVGGGAVERWRSSSGYWHCSARHRRPSRPLSLGRSRKPNHGHPQSPAWSGCWSGRTNAAWNWSYFQNWH